MTFSIHSTVFTLENETCNIQYEEHTYMLLLPNNSPNILSPPPEGLTPNSPQSFVKMPLFNESDRIIVKFNIIALCAIQ